MVAHVEQAVPVLTEVLALEVLVVLPAGEQRTLLELQATTAAEEMVAQAEPEQDPEAELAEQAQVRLVPIMAEAEQEVATLAEEEGLLVRY